MGKLFGISSDKPYAWNRPPYSLFLVNNYSQKPKNGHFCSVFIGDCPLFWLFLNFLIVDLEEKVPTAFGQMSVIFAPGCIWLQLYSLDLVTFRGLGL